ncbi:uncharacterized protein LOC134699510 [Mytilus trossulus]|uniref:uncharacterized protein LOC134699510 n=1 Tax=Mytilus trossulus TaxID=6551 RepID=UPI003005846E
MEETGWSDMVENYPKNTQMVKFLTLIDLRENNEIRMAAKNIDKCNCDLTAQSKEVLCRWRRDRLVRPTIRVLEQALVNSRKGARCLDEVVRNVDPKTLRAVETITDRIRDNADKIIQDIQISQILYHMMTHLVISANDRRDIEHYPRQNDQNKALLDIVI